MTRPANQSMEIKILVVDDEQEITELLVRHFTFKGYDISGVNDPLKAIKMIENDNYHVVISDIVMPDMDGIELLKRIKAHNGGIKVIMITGYVTLHNVLSAMRNGAENVFFKPLKDLESLEAAVDDAIDNIGMWQNILKELRALGQRDVKHA